MNFFVSPLPLEKKPLFLAILWSKNIYHMTAIRPSFDRDQRAVDSDVEQARPVLGNSAILVVLDPRRVLLKVPLLDAAILFAMEAHFPPQYPAQRCAWRVAPIQKGTASLAPSRCKDIEAHMAKDKDPRRSNTFHDEDLQEASNKNPFLCEALFYTQWLLALHVDERSVCVRDNLENKDSSKPSWREACPALLGCCFLPSGRVVVWNAKAFKKQLEAPTVSHHIRRCSTAPFFPFVPPEKLRLQRHPTQESTCSDDSVVNAPIIFHILSCDATGEGLPTLVNTSCDAAQFSDTFLRDLCLTSSPPSDAFFSNARLIAARNPVVAQHFECVGTALCGSNMNFVHLVVAPLAARIAAFFCSIQQPFWAGVMCCNMCLPGLVDPESIWANVHLKFPSFLRAAVQQVAIVLSATNDVVRATEARVMLGVLQASDVRRMTILPVEMVRSPICVVCQGPVQHSLVVYCCKCAHGGHVEHLEAWWQMDYESECPSGCGCVCEYGETSWWKE